MTVLALNITDKKYNYDKIILDHDKFCKNNENINLQAIPSLKTKKKIKKLQLDSAFVNYLVRELMISQFYRAHFTQKWNADSNEALTLILQTTKYNLIDYNWNEKVYVMVRERCELDHALSWLSTLGGAFSALGDYFPQCADTAGKISINQLRLALRLGDPNIASRCRLYLSLSLIQKKKFTHARRIISREFQWAKQATIVDFRLLNMCKGIWSKLQYEYAIDKNARISLSKIVKKMVL